MDPHEKIVKSDEDWRRELDADAYAVLREAATERPWTGAYLDEKGAGVFRCRACGMELFDANTKYDSGSGWPSFTDPMVAEAVELRPDSSHGMVRTEVVCARCGGHLGHVFDDGPGASGQRYCINSVALDFDPSRGGPPQPS